MPFIQTVQRASTRYRVRWSESGVRKSRNFTDLAEAQRFAGALGVVGGRATRTVADRIGRLVEIDAAGCWIWRGYVNKEGYGQMTVRRRVSLAHRVSYEEFVGPIPPGLVIDHLCRVRHCVSPLHLEPVTQRENVMRSPIAQGALNAGKTHCPSGHPYSEENTRTYVHPNRVMRVCITCQRAAARRASALYAAKRKAGAA